MYDLEILIINSYIENRLFIPKINWSKNEFKYRSYSRWAAYELLERVIEEDMLLPSYITGREKKSLMEIINSFIFDMTYCYEKSNSIDGQKLYSIAIDTANDIGCLFI